MRRLLCALRQRLGGQDSEDGMALLVQFIKFGIVGVSNTLISYSIEMLGYYVVLSGTPWPERVRIAVVSAAAFFLSVLNSYYWNSCYVFADEGRKTFGAHISAFLKMVFSYALTGLVLAPVLKIWIHERGVVYWLASLATLVLTVPLNFALNKLWAFRGKGET